MTAPVGNKASLWRVSVSARSAANDAHGAAVLRDIHELGLKHVTHVASSRISLLQGPIGKDVARRVGEQLLADPVTEVCDIREGGDDRTLPGKDYEAAIEVHLKGGVMDPVAGSTLEAMADMGIETAPLEVATVRLYRLKGVASVSEVEAISRRLLSNGCIEDVYLTGFGRHDPRPDHLPVAPTRAFELRHVPVRQLDEAALARLARDAHLFLSVGEMSTIQDYYRKLDRDPTDLELEMLAQTWSEHCVHKTLKASVCYRGEPFPASSTVAQKPTDGQNVEIRYGNLLKDTIARATDELIESGRVDWCLSVFEDNAGIITFDDEYAIAFKVETHNHPSAIEPYGGAATGIGGVIRDVLGCGLGAKPIANTDVFCFAPPNFPLEMLPKGVLHPRRVFKGVVSGVRDYGNRMGIPTINGAILFDDRYLGNPLVFCGCLGLIPRNRIHKEPQPGDLVVVIGGRTGRDGIHGATFSSAELTDTHAEEFSHAVQIGDAITEKKVLDAMLQARDHENGCLYTAVTDCGAGGLSSAVGEMAARLGAEVELAKVPLKYAGLRYDEIWISEAQERMVLSVPPERWETLRDICEAENVEATVIGVFRDDGRLVIRYEGRVVGELDTTFLHEGLGRLHKEATWSKPAADETARRACAGTAGFVVTDEDAVEASKSVWPPGSRYRDELLYRLSRPSAASKEWVIRQYDHEVQGASVVKPLVGPGQGPSDGSVIRPRLGSARGVALANGIAPVLHGEDPYWMAVAAIDEAIRNIVCVGGDPAHTAILDNFCWGNCEDPRTMGALVRACQGCYDAAITYGTPFISGKDSLNNEFALDPADGGRLSKRMPLFNNRIRIPETLLVSALGVIDDVGRCVSMDAKPGSNKTDNAFFFVGLRAKNWPEVSVRHAAALHGAVAGLIRVGAVLAVHDCGDDGVMPALAEMALAGQCGVEADFSQVDPFAAVPCGYVLEVAEADGDQVEALAERLEGVSIQAVGRTRPSSRFAAGMPDGSRVDVEVADLAGAWRSSLNW
ncbi:MAG: phosphoribosylformylglycinamidine synthase [Phycisphaerae bacterium]|nr:phosphoribosylformylglycinamidine synthase [Phycisphaerae bacterium]